MASNENTSYFLFNEEEIDVSSSIKFVGGCYLVCPTLSQLISNHCEYTVRPEREQGSGSVQVDLWCIFSSNYTGGFGYPIKEAIMNDCLLHSCSILTGAVL